MNLSFFLALTLIETCWTIDIYVDGLGSVTRKRFCVGERVVFRCRRPTTTDTFRWSVSSLLSYNRGLIRVDRGQQNVGVFTLSAIRDTQESVSTLFFDVTERLRSSLPSTFSVSCYGGGREEFTSISVDNLSPPNFSVQQIRNYSSLQIKLMDDSNCAHQYRVRLTDDAGRYSEGLISSTEDFMSGQDIMNVVSTGEPLNLCKHTYNVEVDAVTKGVTQTRSMSPINVDFSDIGRLSNFYVTDDAIHWSVPDTLKDCVTNYQYSFKDPNDVTQNSNDITQNSNVAFQSSDNTGQSANGVMIYNSQDNRIALSQLPEDYCDRILVISPRVATSNQLLYNSRFEGRICEHRFYYQVTEPDASRFTRELTLGLVFGITGLTLFGIVLCCLCMIGCHLHKSKKNKPQPHIGHVENQNHPPPGYADATRNKDNIVPTPSYPQPTATPSYATPQPLETPYQPPPQYSSEIFNA